MPTSADTPAAEPPLPAAEVDALEVLAVDAAQAAARLVIDERPSRVAAATTKSSPTDVVTVMDQRSEELLRSLLLSARPDDAILGEEGADHPGTSGVTWVLDPIDGTVNYLYDVPAYAVSVAAVVGDPRVPGAWSVVAAAVAHPSAGAVFHARVGGGAWRRGHDGSETRLGVGSATALDAALVGTGFAYTAERRRVQAQLLVDVLPQVRDIRRIGSAALDLCLVAAGQLDGYYELGLNAWDFAGGWLVLTEAGGVFTGPGGGAPSGRLSVAGNADVQRQLLQLVDRADLDWV